MFSFRSEAYVSDMNILQNDAIPSITNPIPVATQNASAGNAIALSSAGDFFSQSGMLKYSGFIVDVSGTWVGQIKARGSVDGGTVFFDLPVVSVTSTSGESVKTITANGLYYFPISTDFVKISLTSITSGTVTVRSNHTTGSQSLVRSIVAQGQFNTTLPNILSGENSALQTDMRGRLLINTDKQRKYYSAIFTGLVAAATPTDLLCIIGSATTTVYVRRIKYSGTATATTIGNLLFIKRSALNTAGTSTVSTLTPFDSNDAAATAVVRGYTVNPTALGASLGTIFSTKVVYSVNTGLVDFASSDYLFGSNGNSSMILRGATQQLCVNLNGATITGNNINITVEFEEE